MHRYQEASGPVWPTLPREHRKAPVAIVFCFLRLLFAQVYIRATTCRHALGISPRLATSLSESSPVGARIVLLILGLEFYAHLHKKQRPSNSNHRTFHVSTSTNSALAPPRDGIRRGQPRGCLVEVRPLGVSANTPCGITQASSPTATGARSRSSCESRCVAPSAGTGHPLLHRVGGRRPPSLSLVLKCEREPGTPVIPVCKRRAKGGPLHRAEQCGANHAVSGPCV